MKLVTTKRPALIARVPSIEWLHTTVPAHPSAVGRISLLPLSQAFIGGSNQITHRTLSRTRANPQKMLTHLLWLGHQSTYELVLIRSYLTRHTVISVDCINCQLESALATMAAIDFGPTSRRLTRVRRVT